MRTREHLLKALVEDLKFENGFTHLGSPVTKYSINLHFIIVHRSILGHELPKDYIYNSHFKCNLITKIVEYLLIGYSNKFR